MLASRHGDVASMEEELANIMSVPYLIRENMTGECRLRRPWGGHQAGGGGGRDRQSNLLISLGTT